MSAKRYDFTDQEDVREITKRIRLAYFKLTKSDDVEGASDCAQEVLCRMLGGAHFSSTIDQAVIDYLRTSSGRKGSSSYDQRLRLANTSVIEPEHSDRLFGFDPRSDLDSRLDLDRSINNLRGSRFGRFLEKYRHGYLLAEIAAEENISESRVMQIMERAMELAADRINEETSGETITLDDAALKLGVSHQSILLWVQDGSLPSEKVEGQRFVKVSDCDRINELRNAHGKAWKRFAPWMTGAARNASIPSTRPKPKLETPTAPIQIAGSSGLMDLACDLLRAGHREFAYRAFEIAAQQK